METGTPELDETNVEKPSRVRGIETVTSPEEQQPEQPSEGEHVIDKVVDRERCDDEDNPSAHIGDLLYLVCWYEFTFKDDTWEPVRHLPCNKIISYHKRTQQPLPHEDELRQGRAG